MQIINGDCLTELKKLPDESVHCCVTSPPYWGLRDYGVDGQIGLEKTPDEYVEKLVNVFREVKRVLKNDGTVWLNLGDSYSSTVSTNGGYSAKSTLAGFSSPDTKGRIANEAGERRRLETGLKPKDLVGIPWRVAFALQADGWYLRSDIIWHKPNPMPESVTDRPTKSHEYIFLLAKSQKYYFDNEAVGSPIQEDTIERYKRSWNGDGMRDFPSGPQNHIQKFMDPQNKKREWANIKTVWTVTTKPFKEAHFATFPEKLIIPCIKAGCPKGGVVLDPFGGSGTTGVVAEKLGRDYILIELNPNYIEMADNRTWNVAPLFR